MSRHPNLARAGAVIEALNLGFSRCEVAEAFGMTWEMVRYYDKAYGARAVELLGRAVISLPHEP